jgi:hypothetical protein
MLENIPNESPEIRFRNLKLLNEHTFLGWIDAFTLHVIVGNVLLNEFNVAKESTVVLVEHPGATREI